MAAVCSIGFPLLSRWYFYFSSPISSFATKWYSIGIGFIFGFVWLLIFWVNVLGSKCIWLLQDEFWFHLLTLDFYMRMYVYLDCSKKRLFLMFGTSIYYQWSILKSHIRVSSKWFSTEMKYVSKMQIMYGKIAK